MEELHQLLLTALHKLEDLLKLPVADSDKSAAESTPEVLPEQPSEPPVTDENGIPVEDPNAAR